jgi:cytochrome c oxidase subunit 1
MAAITEPLPGALTRPEVSASGVWSWLTTVDHKRIGLMYIFFAMLFFLVGGTEAFLMRLQLAVPDNHLLSEQFFNELFTMHGTTMIFLAVMPLSIGFINYIVPLQIGARDVAFPRLNALSLWLFVAGGIFLNSSWFLGGAPNAGWYAYAPITTNAFNPSHAIDFYDIGLQLAGIGTLLSGINFVVTILNMRAPGMKLLRMPLFTWTALITSLLIVFAFPAFTGDLILLFMDRIVGTNFFNVSQGGNVLLWQQLFWIFGHPEVYILILPAFGIISEVIPTFARKPIFGYTSMVFATFVIGFMAFMVWSHHMFTIGMGPLVNSAFAATTMAIAVPTGVKIFNWIMTMWGGDLQRKTALYFAIAFIAMFTIGGMSGVMLAVPPADYQFNDSYFLVAHIHYVLVGGALFALFAGAYYWLPRMAGRLMDERLGTWNFWLVFIGFNVTFFPMHFLGLLGMPRRVATYEPGLGLGFWNFVCTVGACILAAGVIVFLVNLFRSLANGEVAGPDPWDGRTIEWSIPVPTPAYNFARVPLIRSRDAWWHTKQAGLQRLPDAEQEDTGSGEGEPSPPLGHGRALHMPSPTALPALVALGLFIAAYGALYRFLPAAIAGMLVAFFGIFRLMYDHDPGYLVEPRGDDA